MIVLLIAVPLAYYLGFGDPREYSFLGSTYEIKESALVTVPYDITKTLAFPDFGADLWSRLEMGTAVRIDWHAGIDPQCKGH